MVSVQRRLNSTERVRIPRNRIAIHVEESADAISFPWASASIDLEGMNLPPNAPVAIEAYYRSSSMRFACGSVSRLSPFERMELTEIDRGGAVRFRLLVIDPEGSGRILASAEGLRPVKDDEGPDKQPLLSLIERDLGSELWRIDVDLRTGPTLIVNNCVPGLATQFRTSHIVQGLVFPQALRIILEDLSAPGEDEEDDYWGHDWRRFLEELGVQSEPDDRSDPDSVRDWISTAVTAFCDLKEFAKNARVSLQSLISGNA